MSGIYIHIPFCKSKCTYCDFASYPKEINKKESYFACLYREIEGRAKQLKGKTFNTIYIGGGTPSFVDSKYIVGAIRQVKKFFTLSENLEITIEIGGNKQVFNRLAKWIRPAVKKAKQGAYRQRFFALLQFVKRRKHKCRYSVGVKWANQRTG